jgi:hypothetical protein
VCPHRVRPHAPGDEAVVQCRCWADDVGATGHDRRLPGRSTHHSACADHGFWFQGPPAHLAIPQAAAARKTAGAVGSKPGLTGKYKPCPRPRPPGTGPEPRVGSGMPGTPCVRTHLANLSAARNWVSVDRTPPLPPGASRAHARLADLNAGVPVSATLVEPPPPFGSGKLGTPCARMQSANSTAGEGVPEPVALLGPCEDPQAASAMAQTASAAGRRASSITRSTVRGAGSTKVAPDRPRRCGCSVGTCLLEPPVAGACGVLGRRRVRVDRVRNREVGDGRRSRRRVRAAEPGYIEVGGLV